VSYFYIKKGPAYYDDLLPILQKEGGLFMTDSGGFSFMGSEITDEMTKESYWISYLEEYVEWLKKHSKYIFVAANLDLDKVVGRDVVRKWNKKYFEPLEKEMNIVYVAHEDEEMGDPHGIQHFTEYCARYKYVGINQSQKKFAHRFYTIARLYGCRVHGFAWTELSICKRYPFFSSDSSVSGDSTVTVRNGNTGEYLNTSIEELFNMFGCKRTTPTELYAESTGWQTLTVNENNRVVWEDMSAVVQHKVTKRMLRLHIEGGNHIDVTEDHSIIQMEKDGSLSEKKTSELLSGDYVLIPKRLPFRKTEEDISDLLLEFFGLWIGDGHHSGKYRVGISCWHNLETRNLVTRVAELFGAKVTLSKNGFDCSMSNVRLRGLMEELGVVGKSHTKRVPGFVFGLSERQVGVFLRGYFSADGTGEGLGCSTVSENLKNDLVLLLNGMCIQTTVSYHSSGTFEMNGNTYNKKEAWAITIRDHNSKKRFLDKVDFCVAHKHNSLYLDVVGGYGKGQQWSKKLGVPVSLSLTGRVKFKRDSPLISNLKITQKRVLRDRNADHFNSKVLNNDLMYLMIKSIEELPLVERVVYDLEVPGFEKFIANGVVVHNTTWLGGVRYGTTYDYDGKNFKAIDYKKKYRRRAKSVKYKEAGIDYEGVKVENRIEINKMNLLGWMGFRKEFLKMANLKLTNKIVYYYERKR